MWKTSQLKMVQINPIPPTLLGPFCPGPQALGTYGQNCPPVGADHYQALDISRSTVWETIIFTLLINRDLHFLSLFQPLTASSCYKHRICSITILNPRRSYNGRITMISKTYSHFLPGQTNLESTVVRDLGVGWTALIF